MLGKLFDLRFLLILPILIICCSKSNGQSRPNVLIFIADDMGVDAYAPYGLGTDKANTPQLDSVAAKGILFNNAYAYSTCAPSRASIMTGLYGQ